MNFKRIMSALLTLVMVFGAVVFTGNVATVETNAAYEDKVDAEGNPVISYTTQGYNSPEAKLKDMVLMKEQDGYKLYFEEFTGEIAFEDTKTGEILFSNPYDIASKNWASPSIRQQILSQLVIKYEENKQEKTMYSYVEAALRGQIITKNIKNGIRVEYTVGELATQRLVPRMISMDRFQSMIIDNIDKVIETGTIEGAGNAEGEAQDTEATQENKNNAAKEAEKNKTKLLSFYKDYNPFDTRLTEKAVKEMQAAFPITKQFAIYVCDINISSKELKDCETIIKTYCPNYTFEEMDQDHADCDYVASDEAPANFKMAIEYTISEKGLEARLPASGIRFDESNFTLKSVTMLPYMGSGSFYNEGYTFIPDGSGTLIRFSDAGTSSTYNVAGQLYGADFAYHEISGQNSETMRLPVFGVVEQIEGSSSSASTPMAGADAETTTDARGYCAIITEGDSMATLMSEHGGNKHAYNNVYASFEPRPSDQYNLADSISTGANASWTVTSSRKYTGSYRIQYIMLDDKAAVEETGRGYEASYVGMAEAYRNYLEDTGIITRLTKEETGKDIPLYIEAFGSIKTNEKFLSLPVTVDTPLTTFEDVAAIYAELSEDGVKDINFRLTGYYNGGLDNTYPSKLKWVKNLGGEDGLEDLIKDADEKGYGVFPEFDLAYMKTSTWFDGVSDKRDLVKSIDDRYMSKRNYDAAMQSFESDFALAISSSVYSYFLEKIEADLEGYDKLGGISASTLGTDLNSDFDDDEPYNREDSKEFTMKALEDLDEKYSVMIDGGNAYALRYADHIIDVPTESSNFLRASESVPFYAMVLHGYVNYTASALNMEGDIQYAILKSIENGASLYFTLCYENTSALKENEQYNKYYSVSYDIWKEDIVEYYNTVNVLLGDLQTQVITDHEFVVATRTITEEEEALTEEELEELKAEEEKAKADAERDKKRQELLASRGQSSSGTGSTNKRPTGGSGAETSKVEVESGSVIRVVYENGTSFVINYNSFAVDATIDGENVNIEPLSYVELNSEKGGDE